MKNLTAWCDTPIGRLKITGSEEGISEIIFDRSGEGQPDAVPDGLAPAVRQLGEYFRGERREFALRLAPAGTAFQKSVWSELARIPFGGTTTYGRIAAALGKPGAARAVGQANHVNPLPIIIPCHRVVGGGSDLRGYGGGLWRKRWLLEHEGSAATMAGPSAPPSGRRKPGGRK